MKALVLLLAGSLAACQSDTTKINERLDKLEKLIVAQCGAGGGRAAAGQQRPQRPEPDRSKTYAVPIENDFFEGPADAKITVVKAYEYACPYCDRVRPTMDELIKKYGNDVRIVSKHLVVHPPTATSTALGFCAAQKQGKAKQMDSLMWDKIFKARQFDADKCWESDAGCPNLNNLATELQLDLNKFKADLKACMPLVQQDMRDLQKL